MEPQRAHDASHRFRARSAAFQPTRRDRRAGVRRSATQQATDPLEPARAREGQPPMTLVLHGSQHREACQQRLGAVKGGKCWTNGLAKRQNRGMTSEKTAEIAGIVYLQPDFINRPGTRVTNGVFGQPR